MITFPVIPVIIFFVWLTSGIIAPARIPFSELKQPAAVKSILVIITVLCGPIVPLFFLIKTYVLQHIGKYREEKIEKELALLDAITFENSTGSIQNSDLGSEQEEKNAVSDFKRLLFQALSVQATEILVDPAQGGNGSVRLRVNGTLQPAGEITPEILKYFTGAVKVIANMDISERRMPQNGEFIARINGESFSFKVATVGVFAGEKIVITSLGKTSGPPELDTIGFNTNELAAVKNILSSGRGLLLICGPAGSGKSTTRSALLQAIDVNCRSVVVIEEHVDDPRDGVTYMETNIRLGLTFAKQLQAAQMLNPDVISFDSISDQDTAEEAVKAARSSLVITSVSRTSTSGALEYLRRLGVPCAVLSATLCAVINQRLVRNLCKQCRIPARLPDELTQYFQATGLQNSGVCTASGCPQCGSTGCTGKRAIFDLMTVDDSTREILRNGDGDPAGVKNAIENTHGAATMALKAFSLAAAGTIPLEDAYSSTSDWE